MPKELFGTDGIRGVAGEFPLDPATVYATGIALGNWAKVHSGTPEVMIGMDTRESGPQLAAILTAGLAVEGVAVRSAGLITTPGVAYLTRTGPFVAGVMISASHNPYQDNGLKVFGHSGFKLPDSEEHELEQAIFSLLEQGLTPASQEPSFEPRLDEQYLDYLASTLPGGTGPYRIVLDCGNGAAVHLAPALFRRLGAEVAGKIGCAPDGRNINLGCGALHADGLRERVVALGADLGVAFDGDADRCIVVSSSGKIVDGDQVLLVCGRHMKRRGHLAGDTVVATVMSNLGLERLLAGDGIQLVRTPVGDKYVLEEMIRLDAAVGGEQSGHVIFREFATTGDGMLTAVRLLEAMRDSGRSLDELTADFVRYPQTLVNVRVKDRRPLAELAGVQREIRSVEDELGTEGRVLVRFSGTEPLARVMVEGPTRDGVLSQAERIAAAIRAELGS